MQVKKPELGGAGGYAPTCITARILGLGTLKSGVDDLSIMQSENNVHKTGLRPTLHRKVLRHSGLKRRKVDIPSANNFCNPRS